MRLNIFVSFLALILFSGSFYILQNSEKSFRINDSGVKLFKTVGNVSLKYPGELWWRGGIAGDGIPLSSVLRTSSDSIAKIIFDTGDELVIGPMSLIKIILNSANDLDINVFSGTLSFIKKKSQNSVTGVKRKISFKKIELPANSDVDLSLIYEDKSIEINQTQIKIEEIEISENKDALKTTELAKLEVELEQKQNLFVKTENLPVVIEPVIPELKKIDLPESQNFEIEAD